MLAQPVLVARDVHRGRRAREVRIASDDRLVDARVLRAREVERNVVGHAMPKTRPHRTRREALEQRAQHGVAGRLPDHVVKRGVGLDEILDAVAGVEHPVELAAQRNLDVVVGPQRRHRGRLGLEHSAHLEQLEHRAAAKQVRREARRLEEVVRLETADVRAVALPHLEHPREREGAHRLAE